MVKIPGIPEMIAASGDKISNIRNILLILI
jgi:hypothetical protein